MKDIRIIEPRQIIKHEILCPKVELQEKKWGKRKWKIEVWKIWKETERRKENGRKINQLFKIEILIEIVKEDKEMQIKT